MALFSNRIRIGDLLVQKGYITDDQLSTALEEQREKKQRLGEVLINLGYVTEEQFATVYCDQSGIQPVDLKEIKLNEELLQLIGEDVMRKQELIPFGYDEDNFNCIKVAMADPMNLGAMDDIQLITGMEVKPFYASASQITIQLDKLYGKKQAMEAAEQFQAEHADEYAMEGDSGEDESVSDAPIVKIVRTMLQEAVRMGSSDIHIEPLEKSVRVRYRIDGVLQQVMEYNTNVLSAMVARIKIISGLDISEKRKPQDGRLTLDVDGDEFDVRVSILPTVYGEKTVMRLTKKKGLTREKKYLGLYPEDERRLDNITHNPHGIILITGPTGSGKSTTCYTVLNELNKETVNIITVEDPVEANVPGVNQVQVNVKAELTFASALRSILRQDPDIIGVGEIRDSETAEIALRAAITGHLVLSTIHTNDAKTSIDRLLCLGVEPYLIAGAVKGIVSQRLVRKICPHCKTAYEPEEAELKMLRLPSDRNYTFYKGKGCPDCFYTGYRGRMAVFEILVFSSDMKRAITSGDAMALEKAIDESGFVPILTNGVELVMEGQTTAKEVSRAVSRTDY